MKKNKYILLSIILLLTFSLSACKDINITISLDNKNETEASTEALTEADIKEAVAETEAETVESTEEETKEASFYDLFGFYTVEYNPNYTPKDYAKLFVGGSVQEAIRIIDEHPYDGSDFSMPFIGTYEYNMLNEENQALYNEIYEKASNFEYFYYSAEEYGYDFLDNLITIWGAVTDDSPEIANYFYLKDVIEGDMTAGMESVYFRPNFNNSVQADMDELSSDAILFEAVCDYIVDNMPSNYCTYDKYRYLAMVIAFQTDYDYDCYGGYQNATAFGSICGGYSICEGYSNGFYYLCKKADLYCERVTGSAGGVAHMWNIVGLEEGLYFVDVTWMDDSFNYPDENDWYTYFMVTQDDILLDHVIEDDYRATGEYLPKPY